MWDVHSSLGLSEALPPLREKVPTIPPEVEQVVLTALAKDPLQRFATIQAFANALEQASRLTEQNSFTVPVQPSHLIPPAEQSSQGTLPTILATPSTSETFPQMPWQQSATTSARTGEITPAGSPLSRRMLLGGAIGLAALVGGGITWLTLAAQKLGSNAAPNLSLTSTRARRSSQSGLRTEPDHKVGCLFSRSNSHQTSRRTGN